MNSTRVRSDTTLQGDVDRSAGAYLFRASDRGLVLVYDEKQTKVVAATLTETHTLGSRDLEMSGTLSHDWAVRALSLGDWQYTFHTGREPVTVAFARVSPP